MKVYTRTGDKGTTGLVDGSRTPKDSARIESYGTVDELNSILGICRQSYAEIPPEKAKELDCWLYAIQNDLFNLGSDLATPFASRSEKMIHIEASDVTQLEKIIDYCQETLPPLKEFVLPGGTLLNAYLHLARTVCRRAERMTFTLSKNEKINENAIPYLNRLSDLMFVLSRWVQTYAQKQEVKWDKKQGVRTISI